MNHKKLALLDVLRARCKDDAEFVKKSKSIYGKGNCPAALIPWIPEIEIYEPTCIHDGPRSIFAQIDKTPYTQNLWALVIFAMPPYFHNKYHSIDIKKLITYSVDSNYIALSSVYCMWNEGYGLPLLNYVHEKQKSIENIKLNVKDKLKWHKEITNAVHYLRVIWEGMDIDKYKDRDLVDDSDTFIIEPKILIQLPWKSILFHQWLAAILLVIVDIEERTLDLKHWPVHSDIIPTAKYFLRSMQSLKERILLGFAILNEQITSYPILNSKYPQYIMDIIIIPSLPFLESLYTGNLRDVIESLSLKSESIQTSSNAQYIPEEYFTIDLSLAELYSKLQYNFPMWISKDIPTIYPVVNDEIEIIIERITKEKPDIPITNITKKSLSLEENYLLFDYIKNNYEVSGKETDIAVGILKEVISQGLFKGITNTQVKKFFQSRKTKQKTKAIFYDNTDDIVVQALQHAVMFHYIHNLLTKPNNYVDYESITSQLIVSKLRVLRGEQIYRLINACKIIFDIKSKNKTSTISPKKILEINAKLLKIKNDVLKMNREVLWSKFPEEWQQSIDSEMSPKSDEPNDIFKTIEYRIGRLLFNIGKNSYQTVESGNVYFPDTNFIQFIVPSLVGALYENYKANHEINKEYLALIYGLIELFENNYKHWLVNIVIEFEITVHKIPGLPLTPLPIQHKDEWSSINMKMRELVRQVIGYKVLDSGDYFTYIFGIDKVINNTHDYTNQLGSEDDDVVGLQFIKILNKLYNSVYKLSHYLFKTAFTTFKIQIPGNEVVKHPQISEMYFVSTVISELQTLFEISKVYLDPGDKREATDGAIEDQLHSMFTDKLKCWRYDILEHVMEPEQNELEMEDFIKESKDILLPIYNQLKEYRKVRSEILSRLKHFLPFSYLNNTPIRFNNVMQLYIDGNLNALDSQLFILFDEVKKTGTKKMLLYNIADLKMQ